MNVHDARSEFQGGFTTPRKTTRFVVIHHAASHYKQLTGLGDVRAIRDWHTKGRGWPGIGYHEVLAEETNGGPIACYVVSDPETQRAHIWGRNHECFGICAATDFGTTPPAQKWLIALRARVAAALARWPDAQVVGHTDIALPGHGTSCPAGGWPAWRPAILPAPTYTADHPILSPPPAGLTVEALARAVWARCAANGEYTAGDVCGVIVPAYWLTCARAGVCPVGALAQCLHETGNLHAALAHRRDKDGHPLRNPAGIGVTGAEAPTPRPGYVWDADQGTYRAACGFAAWSGPGGSVEAHVGRLAAYAVRPKDRTPEQARLVAVAMRARQLPAACHGSAPTWLALGHGPNRVPGCGWAGANDAQGHEYGARIAAIARALLTAAGSR